MRFGFEHSYAALPPGFFTEVRPTPVVDPRLVVFNRPLAGELGLDASAVEREAAGIFSGNTLPDDARPIAMAYAGHQFGHFVPQLGDGRAILLGELRDGDGVLRDVQLKGSGLTPWSRGADGRAALGPMLREYLISEAMHALGIPTTRSLAVVTTGERVRREDSLPGAILARVAGSHVRVGTFQYFAARANIENLRHLLDYVIARHYPQAREAPVPALAVLQQVADRQAALVAGWMLVGFIHGVMNTDNMAISGETIDYGPCAFLDHYDPATVFSSIDQRGRYAYVNQPTIAQWNLARFAETLLPLIDADADKAVNLAMAVIDPFISRFDALFLTGMRSKTGLAGADDGDMELIKRLLAAMRQRPADGRPADGRPADGRPADFTLVFRRLSDVAADAAHQPALRALFPADSPIDEWLRDWRSRLARDARGPAERAAAMHQANPAFIPRNHRVEAALQAATDDGDLAPFRKLLAILQRPCDDQPAAAEYMLPPEASERVYQTFCGT